MSVILLPLDSLKPTCFTDVAVNLISPDWYKSWGYLLICEIHHLTKE